MRKNVLIVVLLIIAAVGSAAMVAQAQSGGELEVRIAARRLADGRTEFALQQREGASWSDRILPSARFLPAEPPVGQWLVSTPIAIAAPYYDSCDDDRYDDDCDSGDRDSDDDRDDDDRDDDDRDDDDRDDDDRDDDDRDDDDRDDN